MQKEINKNIILVQLYLLIKTVENNVSTNILSLTRYLVIIKIVLLFILKIISHNDPSFFKLKCNLITLTELNVINV
jgi:hypothetical protein